jgi:hypothetical protein
MAKKAMKYKVSKKTNGKVSKSKTTAKTGTGRMKATKHTVTYGMPRKKAY